MVRTTRQQVRNAQQCTEYEHRRPHESEYHLEHEPPGRATNVVKTTGCDLEANEPQRDFDEQAYLLDKTRVICTTDWPQQPGRADPREDVPPEFTTRRSAMYRPDCECTPECLSEPDTASSRIGESRDLGRRVWLERCHSQRITRSACLASFDTGFATCLLRSDRTPLRPRYGGRLSTEVRLPRVSAHQRTLPLIRDNVIHTSILGGGDGSRTHDLYIANVALCQLSYTPEGLQV